VGRSVRRELFSHLPERGIFRFNQFYQGLVATITVGVKGLNHPLEQSNAGVSTGKKSLSSVNPVPDGKRKKLTDSLGPMNSID